MNVKKTLSLLLAAAVLSGLLLVHASAQSSLFTITANLTFGQTEARSMLDAVNDLRKPANAWYWTQDNKTKQTASGLRDLTYDYGLEKIAMQRAAEIAVKYSHTRPNGKDCFSANTFSYSAVGENIAWGYNSYARAEDVFIGWSEADEMYEGQGHRRNMLGSFTGIGIGHVIVGDYHFWVQEFGSPLTNTAYTAPLDSSAKMTVECRSDL
ncbi:MAG: CAP domain-containing protein, partial [Clostridia bacterium]|nr:CAP domain-containing protein [Clostridia bacterium]